jgi:hypothetical protein
MTTDFPADDLRTAGFAFVGAQRIEEPLRQRGFQDWDGFAASWNDLGMDSYMADGGRYRRRRYAAYSVSADSIVRKPHQPHYQSRDYNPLNGGIERWFEPITAEVERHPVLRSVLQFGFDVFVSLTPVPVRPAAWHVEVHQFRVEARAGQAGLPTPEGAHRDGVDWVLVLLVDRRNATSGATTILDLAHRPLGEFTLEHALDTALVDDSRVFHGVTPILPIDPSHPGYRDVLVVTFRR